MAINRTNKPTEARFSISCNIVLTGSKKLTHEEQEALLTVNKIHILITDAEDENNILVAETADSCQFEPDKNGKANVGYKLHTRDVRFSNDDQAG